ncbi:hypothetical protein GIB67_017784 [Kingdonia uniflora]|uniref:Polygalacturonase n=1 Tax=Kingdonia uniflora TaxID=39325 RepID=A0A7J7MPK8_9MAGN|nr:hypothetical protein GIB67_017784 [Kingdonia uniflora]
MGTCCTVLILVLAVLNTVVLSTSSDTIDVSVFDYGATGNGYTDDSQAFLRTWNFACSLDLASSVNVIIPSGYTFLVNPITFQGPCRPSNIGFQVFGTIKSPETIDTWYGIDATQWLAFQSVKGLAVNGNGTIKGQGWNWWASSCRTNHKKGCTTKQPTAIKFYSCEDSTLSNLHFINSANFHILVYDCNSFHVNNVDINSPETSPNTDGIHIQASKHIVVNNTNMKCGDDCVSIGDRTSDIKISNINCGPGHGISIGSLGKGGSSVQVEDIHVKNVTFYKSTNGVRIKTWQGGSGYARRIIFEQLSFTSVRNPIIIDQNYFSQGKTSPKGVQISEVTYSNAVGTSSTKMAIQLNCSESVACTEILFDSIQLTSDPSVSALRHHRRHRRHRHHQPPAPPQTEPQPSPQPEPQPPPVFMSQLTSSCTNAYGTTNGVIQPDVPCLHRE